VKADGGFGESGEFGFSITLVPGEFMAFLAKDLSPQQRQAIESLLGRSMSEKEAVTIRAYEPAAVSAQRRAEIIARMEAYFTELDATREPTSVDEADAVFEEAMRQTRPNYRTHR
jgi:hypothetical protein